MLADKYIPSLNQNFRSLSHILIWEFGIRCSTTMFEDVKEYLNWYNSRKDISDDLKDPLAPCVGLVLQRTHLVTGDDAHYVAKYRNWKH